MDDELLESYAIAVRTQGQKIVELERRIKTLERAVMNHVMDFETAHKL